MLNIKNSADNAVVTSRVYNEILDSSLSCMVAFYHNKLAQRAEFNNFYRMPMLIGMRYNFKVVYYYISFIRRATVTRAKSPPKKRV